MSYEGICVGGPLAGERRSHPSMAFIVQEAVGLSLTPVAGEMQVKSTTYIWGVLPAVWLDSTMSNTDAMAFLLNAYIEKCNREKRERP